jgi:hypothetical protein
VQANVFVCVIVLTRFSGGNLRGRGKYSNEPLLAMTTAASG